MGHRAGPAAALTHPRTCAQVCPDPALLMATPRQRGTRRGLVPRPAVFRHSGVRPQALDTHFPGHNYDASTHRVLCYLQAAWPSPLPCQGPAPSGPRGPVMKLDTAEGPVD